VLVGVSDYEDAAFPPIRAARNSLTGMHKALVDTTLCSWPEEAVSVIANPKSPADLLVPLTDLARTTSGVLLVYYVGHGALSERGELSLTVAETRFDYPRITGVPWSLVADVLRNSPARVRIAILDCCFAGQAIEALAGHGDMGMADITHVGGVYTLTATTRNHTAHVPPPDQQDTACTSFTGALLELITHGIPGKPARLTFADIYPELRQRLQAKGLPAPNQRGSDTASLYPFTANTAGLTAQAAGAADTARPDAGPRAGADPAASGPSRRRWRPRKTVAGTLALALAVIGGFLAYAGLRPEPGRTPSGSGLSSPVAVSKSEASHHALVSSTSATAVPASESLSPGYVTIQNLATGNCFDSTDSGSVFTWTCDRGGSQLWSPLLIDAAVYALKNQNTGLCLTGSSQVGINSAPCDTSDSHQQWRWNESESSATFVHMSNGNCLAEPVSHSPTTVECDGSKDQEWRIG
jgi:hypothetical protein